LKIRVRVYNYAAFAVGALPEVDLGDLRTGLVTPAF